jgi:methylphosphotriester-DNA--protein-cysteine methyltransferase
VPLIFGDRRSKTYYRPDCPGYNAIPAKERVTFGSTEEAARAGYKAAKGCPPQPK